MTRGLSDDERRKQALKAIAEQDALPMEPLTVRIKTAVKLTGIGRSTLYELIQSGEIETLKIGRSTFIPYRCIKRLVER
ncbi:MULTISPECIES: helix-turn-helix domain-containing protein [unclassified Sphingobium]|uniref:helix-turn-helix domain-containing protein n=1 Tax=unclassified Sphingobium TaxID=2611147 RepID=UPI000D167B0C|nr:MULTISPECIES: helix-turn-helix domain-containing protein [unclassified Sphingobium]MBG6118183.1 excisionase family DNA binding protein [Sphingobium sp. JAI105]PSO09996.1 excisionase [Sphingobium sp. AEW4]TWC98316.1 excisionase family DNA binding protein [Sphingobium sp. AEW010]TWD18272.1 excisionase family DNA binding protein [Sphingobium sp. AEW013]TWD20813.1 excisionase family DNA binding protein [Sphingobium sp. AEW001]